MPGLLTIAGLGPGDPLLRTVAVQRALDGAQRIILRTGIHPGVEDLLADPRVTTCDDLYERFGSFDEVYEAVAERVIAACADGDVVFAVPGHPFFGERSVAVLLGRVQRTGARLSVLGGVSALDVVASALGVDPLAAQVQVIDATHLEAAVAAEPFGGGLLDFSPARPCLVIQVYAPRVASAAKLALGRLFPEDHQVTLLTAAGVAGQERLERCPLFEIDRRPVDHLTSLWVPALAPLAATRSPFTLQRIAARLRAPAGCPWDRKQTHASLRNAVIEEAYEVVDAIDAGDPAHFADELGDLLLQVALHAQIAEEAGNFVFEDVVQQVTEKLVRRHPHVFGDVVAHTPDDVVQTWDGVKAQERARAGQSLAADVHPLDRLPRSMPALRRVAHLLAEKGAESRSPSSNGAYAEGQRGAELLAAVEALVAAGLDPEAELERAARARFATSIRTERPPERIEEKTTR